MPQRLRLPLLLLLASASPSACAPQMDEACARFSVDEVRDVEGRLLQAPVVPLAVVGRPARVALFAPITSCLSDVLRMDVRVTDPRGLPVSSVRVESLAPVGAIGAVRGELVFTPAHAGPHALEVSFEPALGVRSVLLDVAEDGAALPASVVRIRPAVCGEAWPLSDDALACESGGVVTVHGGVTAAFPGRELVVTGGVLWSVDPSGVLERRELRGGVLVRTHAWPGYAQAPAPGHHDTGLAVRRRSDGALRAVRVVDGGVRERDLEDGAFLLDRDDMPVAWTNHTVGFEGELVWRSTPPGVSAFRSPWATSAPALTLTHRPAPSVRPTSGFERVPLWLDEPLDDGRRVLVTVDERGLSMTAWDAAQVLRVGQRHVLTKEGDTLRITAR